MRTTIGQRNPYLITRALRTFMWASILAAVSNQLATTTDAVVVSNLIGTDAISAINVVMPVLTLFTCLMILFGIGASIVAAKAIGRCDEETANGMFTSCLISSGVTSVALAILMFFFSPFIVEILTQGNEDIYRYALPYLRSMSLFVPFLMLAGVLENFVKTDGNPRIVMIAVIVGSVLNLAFDIVFVKYCSLGIRGSAYATGLNYIVALLICCTHFRSPYNSLRWRLDRKRLFKYVGQSVSQGFAMSINTFLLAVSITAINAIVLHAQGTEGLYCWSVCLQLFLIMQMALSGISSSIYSIGGVLVGEQDMQGLSILNNRCLLYQCAAMAVVMLFIFSAPDMFGRLFGSVNGNGSEFLPAALRIYSLMIIPYSVVALLRSNYQILGRYSLSLFLSVSQLLLMAAFVWGFSFISPETLWWGFPLSSFCLFAGVLVFTGAVHRRNRNIRMLTLIPETDRVESLNISVKLEREDIENATCTIADFLRQQHIDATTTYELRLVCEELMYNLLNYAVEKNPEKHFFDLHIRCHDGKVNILIKDDGRPFNPILKQDSGILFSLDDEHLGLKLVNRLGAAISYKYMYNQNMVQITFQTDK